MSQYSASMRNSALDFRFLRSIGTNFPLHAELRSIGIFAELRKMWKSNGEFSASNIFHFLNLFHYIFRMMRKCCPNTPQEVSASKLAENDGFCGNLRYGQYYGKHLTVKITKWHNSFNTDPSAPIFLQNLQWLMDKVW